MFAFVRHLYLCVYVLVRGCDVRDSSRSARDNANWENGDKKFRMRLRYGAATGEHSRTRKCIERQSFAAKQ